MTKKEKSEKKSKEKLEPEIEESEEEPEDLGEDSELENKLEDVDGEIDIQQFSSFMQDEFNDEFVDFGDAKVSLEKINPVQRGTFVRLEGEVGEGNSFGKGNEEDDAFKYNAGSKGNSEEPKYTNYAGDIVGPKNVSIESLGRGHTGNPFSETQKVGDMKYEKVGDSINQEKYDPVKMQDIQKLGRQKETLDKKEVKYKASY